MTASRKANGSFWMSALASGSGVNCTMPLLSWLARSWPWASSARVTASASGDGAAGSWGGLGASSSGRWATVVFLGRRLRSHASSAQAGRSSSRILTARHLGL